MRNKYRIVADSFNGYEAQVKFWWFPFAWFEMHDGSFISNSFTSLDKCKRFIEDKQKNKSIWES